MIKSLWGFIFGRNLSAVLNETKTVRVKGVRFKIRKVNVTDHLSGSKVLLQTYDIYKTGLEKDTIDPMVEKKMKEHFSSVLSAAVVHPRLTLKEESEGIHVEKLFIDWDMTVGLYNEVMILSYGKKKVRQVSRATK